MLGGKYRDRLRCYCDTPDSNDPKMFRERMKERIAEGFTWLKMDIGINAHLRNIPGTISGNPAGMVNDVRKDHTMLGVEITQKGAEVMADYIMKVREVVGWEIPISAGHFGQMGLNSIIRLGKAFEKCNLAWMEDVLPSYETDMLKKVSDAIDVPICTGEDMYLNGALRKPVPEPCRRRHPPGSIDFGRDPGNQAHRRHGPEARDSLVDGIPKPILNKGYVRVPEGPGLGITLNEEAIKQHLVDNYFDPTLEWNNERSGDQIWSYIWRTCATVKQEES